MEKKKVQTMPRTNVNPTVRIGLIGTRKGQAKTLKPTTVVKADRKIAFPVVMAASTVAPR